MADIETITRPLLDKDTFISKMVALAQQRGNVLPATMIRAYARDRYEGNFDEDLLRDVRRAFVKAGCFVDNDLGLKTNINEVQKLGNFAIPDHIEIVKQGNNDFNILLDKNINQYYIYDSRLNYSLKVPNIEKAEEIFNDLNRENKEITTESLNESVDEVRHYTNKLIDMMNNMSVDPKWLAISLMNYISEDDVAEIAHYNDYFDVDEIESPYNVRQATNHFIELMDDGALDPKDLAENVLLFMSEDNVKEFCHDYEFDEDESEEDTEETAQCGLCKEEFPLSDLKKEKDFGYICDGCERTLLSRGEDVQVEDDFIEECSEPEVSVKEKNAKFRKNSI